MQELLAFRAEARGSVRHHAFPLGSADFPAKVRFPGFAEFAFTALGGAEGKGDDLSLEVLNARKETEVTRLTIAQPHYRPLSQM